MLSILSPEQFKTVPWKNGKGSTVELAINAGGNVDNFDWRLSIADMVQSGVFSDFSGYQRHLVMIAGAGLDLEHQYKDARSHDKLRSIADVASFDGGSTTDGVLVGESNVGVKNFNVMAKSGKYVAEVKTYVDKQAVMLPRCEHCFVYCLAGAARVVEQSIQNQALMLPAQHLLHGHNLADTDLSVEGQQMIVVLINK